MWITRECEGRDGWNMAERAPPSEERKRTEYTLFSQPHHVVSQSRYSCSVPLNRSTGAQIEHQNEKERWSIVHIQISSERRISGWTLMPKVREKGPDYTEMVFSSRRRQEIPKCMIDFRRNAKIGSIWDALMSPDFGYVPQGCSIGPLQCCMQKVYVLWYELKPLSTLY